MIISILIIAFSFRLTESTTIHLRIVGNLAVIMLHIMSVIYCIGR